MFSDTCQWNNCGKKAKRIAAKAEGGIIDICDDCWHEYYRS